MTQIHIKLDGQPIGKGRPRFTKTGHTYTPDRTRKYERRLAAAASDAMIDRGLDPVTRPCTVFIIATFAIPKSWTKAKKLQAQEQRIFPGRPDIDNVAKIALDAINGVVFEDDDQVCGLEVQKKYGEPSLIISVFW